MITQTDIRKLKDVFVTKEQFSKLDNKVTLMDKKIDGLAGKVNDLADILNNLSNSLQKNTEDLIELITSGFSSYEKRMKTIEEKVFKAN